MEESSVNSALIASAADEMNFTINEIARTSESAKAVTKEAGACTAQATIGSMVELNRAAESIAIPFMPHPVQAKSIIYFQE